MIVCGFNANGDLSRINVWGAHGLIGRQSGTNMGTMVYDYVWDNRGNISQVLNPNGAVAYNFRVTAWGEVASDVPAGSANDPYRCLGGELGNYVDVETGLVLCGQRYYDPSGGRWLNRDPINYDGGMNVYAYVTNNPTNYVDPDGLAQEDHQTAAWERHFGRDLNGDGDVDGTSPSNYPSPHNQAMLYPPLRGSVRNLPNISAGPKLRTSRPKLNTRITPVPIQRGHLRRNMGTPPQGFRRPQAHHRYPWMFRQWFASRGINCNVRIHGRWVEGGVHQRWSPHYNSQWQWFIRTHPNANRNQIINFMRRLEASGRYPSR